MIQHKKSKKKLAKKQNEKPQWLDFNADGKPQPSRKGRGYYKAIFIKPRSIRDPNSVYRKLLARLSKTQPQTSDEILCRYNENYERRTSGTITQYLSRFHTWGYTISIGSGNNVVWLLLPDIDVNDGEALYRRALERNAEFQKRIEQAERTRNGQVA